MWPLTNGLRCLEGDEADLFRGAVGMMVDQLVIEINSRIDDEQNDFDEDPLIEEYVEDESVPLDDPSRIDEAMMEQSGELPTWLTEQYDLDPEEPPTAGPNSGPNSGPYGNELSDQLSGGHSFHDDSAHRDDPARYNELDLDDTSDGFGFETPHWFSMWEPEQRIWLLERVTTSMLTARVAPTASAMFEATVEAVYVELADLIAMEITAGTPIEKGSWRASLLDAYVQRCPKDSLLSALQFEATTLDPCLPPAIQKQLKSLNENSRENSRGKDRQDSTESPDWLNWWTMVIERLVDATYGPRLYHDAEALRDGDPRELQRYLRRKGVNSKFCSRIPPLRTHAQTQSSIDRLQAIIFRDE